VFELKLNVERQDRDIIQLQNESDVLKDCMMDVDMSAKGVHQMIAPLKEDVRDLNNLYANLNNQIERIQVKDVSWCQSRITQLEKLNNPANKSLWQLLNHFVHWVEDLEDEVAGLKAGSIQSRNQLDVLEMLLSMIHLRVQVLEEVMEIDPLLTDLTLEEDLDYQDMDDGGAILVEDLEKEREQENIPPLVIRMDTPHLAPVFQSLIPIEVPAPVAPAVEVVDVDAEGEDNA
jgi:hypothetical protein